jgi:hypothetical protein
MKSKTTLLFTSLLLTACSYTPIAPQLQGKTIAEQNAFLVDECEDEAWRGHDSGSHHHNLHKPETQAHKGNMERICHALAKPEADKKTLLAQCKVEAKNQAAFNNKRLMAEHTDRLLEICDGFAQVK